MLHKKINSQLPNTVQTTVRLNANDVDYKKEKKRIFLHNVRKSRYFKSKLQQTCWEKPLRFWLVFDISTRTKKCSAMLALSPTTATTTTQKTPSLSVLEPFKSVEHFQFWNLSIYKITIKKERKKVKHQNRNLHDM